MLTFGQVIANQRKALLLTQRDLSARIGLSTSQLNNLENDRQDPRDRALLEQLSSLLQLEISTLEALAEHHLDHMQLRIAAEQDEFTSLSAFRLSRE